MAGFSPVRSTRACRVRTTSTPRTVVGVDVAVSGNGGGVVARHTHPTPTFLPIRYVFEVPTVGCFIPVFSPEMSLNGYTQVYIGIDRVGLTHGHVTRTDGQTVSGV